MEAGSTFSSGTGPEARGDLWYVDNYILLKDYYDRTISRIAARCVRQGNIAMEEYAHYGYILDVLEEISETGDYIMEHPDLYSYVDKKIAGGIKTLEKSLNEFKTELKNNASPEMIKQDKDELDKMKEALGDLDKSVDPTVGAGMSMDQVIEKLMKNQGGETPTPNQTAQQASGQKASAGNQQGQQPQPQQMTKPQNSGQVQGQHPQGGHLQQQRPTPTGNTQPRPQQQPQSKHPGQGQTQGQRPQGPQTQQQRPAQTGNVPTQPQGGQQRPQQMQKPQPNQPAAGNPPHKGNN